MSAAYVVTIALGPHEAPTWTLVSDSREPVDRSAGVWALDGYGQAWTMPEDWPAQPDPASAHFAVAAVLPEALPPMEVGTPVAVTVEAYFAPASFPILVAEFYGRLTDAVARPAVLPTEAGPQHGLAVEFVAVDYLADLQETYVAAAPWPAEYPNARLDRIWAAAGITDTVDLVNMSAFDEFRALDVDHRPVGEVLEDHLRQVSRVGVLASLNVTGWQRPIVVPLVSTGEIEGSAPAGTVQYATTALSERSTFAGGPLVLVTAGGVVTPSVEPANVTAYKVMDAALVDVDIELRRDKGKATNRVLVSGEFAGLFGEVGPDLTYTVPTVESAFPDAVAARGPITLPLESTFSYYHSAKGMADMYLGDDADAAGQWGAEAVTIHASELATAAEADRFLRDLFPVVAQDIPGWTDFWPYGRPVLLYGLLPAHRLTRWPWLSGALSGADLEIEGGRFDITVHLRPNTPRQAYNIPPDPATYVPAPGDPLSCATLRRDFPTMTSKDAGDGRPYIDPALTCYDARLIRSA